MKFLTSKSNAVRSRDSQSLFILLVFFAFSLFLILQHASVFLYHDDWGIAVLDYVGEQTGFEGRSFSIFKAIDFLRGMYLNWSGRVISIFFHIYAQKWGLWPVRSLQCTVILATILISIIIATRTTYDDSKVYLALLAVMLYLALPVSVLCDGIYWFSASSGYLWGIPFFLFGAYLVVLRETVTLKSSFLFAFAATFHEQMAIAILSYLFTLYLLISRHKDKRPLQFCATTSPVLLAAALTFFAPGNFSRKNSTQDFYIGKTFFDIISSNINRIANAFFWPNHENVFSWFLIFSLCLMLVYILHRGGASRFKNPYSILVLLGCLIYLYAAKHEFLFSAFMVIIYSAALYCVCASSRSGQFIFPIYISALASVAPLLYAPGVPSRSGVPLCILLFVPVLFTTAIAQNCITLPFRTLSVLLLAAIALNNASFVYAGYSSNREINEMNDCQLRLASYMQRNSIGTVSDITLFKLKQPRFSGVMPYDRPLIEKWIKKYYMLSKDVHFEWR